MKNIALINANVIPMEGYSRHSAVLALDGTIAALGTDEEISKKAAEAGVTPIDLHGATVLPGLYDCHAHLALTGHDSMGINLYDAGDIATVLDRLRKADAEWPSDRWLFGQRLDEALLKEKRPPTMQELDEFQRPVFISDRGGHYTLVNRLAFDALGLTPDITGVRVDENGKLTGRLQDTANKTARNRFPWTKEQTLEAMRYTMELALTKGITTIHCQEGFTLDDPSVPLLLEHMDSFPIDLQIYWCVANPHDEPMCRQIGIWGGDILLDGSIGSRTAAFSEPYADGDGCGYLNFSDEEVNNFVEGAVVRDLAVSFHVIGQRGIDQALTAMEKALEKHPEKRETARLRLEHFGFPKQSDIDRAAKMNVRISTQPAFTYLRGGPTSVYRSRLGEAREKAGYPLRRMLDAGLCLGGGSDSDITPLDSLLGIHAAVNQPYPENSVTPYEAVRMYTLDAARCGWEEDKKGSLKVGKQADMVVLAEDPMAVAPATLKDIKVLKTIRRGEIVYEAE